MKKTLFISIFVLLGVVAVSAQQEMCANQISQIINMTEQSCAEMEANEICFGHEDVKIVVNCDSPLSFTTSGDIIPVDATCALRTGAMQASGEWGIALMKISANDTTQTISYVLLGDVEMQNTSSDTSKLRVWTDSDIDVHSGPGSHYNIIESISADTEIYANACNCTRNWLRIVLDDGRIGWVSAFYVTVLGSVEDFPITDADSPLYSAMQAFAFQSGMQSPACENAPKNGIMIQIPTSTEGMFMQVNGVEMLWSKATAFLQSYPGGNLTIDVLDGEGTITANDFTMQLRRGMRMVVPISEKNLVSGIVHVEPYNYEDIKNLPISLLPEAIELMQPDIDDVPYLVGQEMCNVISGHGDIVCPIHFVNADGDNITHMNFEFVYAPQGEWTSEERDNPTLVDGDNYSGRLAWNVSCYLGDANYISQVTWSATITDSMGHISDPLEVSFNCVDG